ncbi:MAG: ABC transporter substrate-binding protein, partial [bacterium]
MRAALRQDMLGPISKELSVMIARRALLTASAAALAAPRFATGQTAARTLRFIPQSNLSSMDPVWSTAVIVRNHGLM